MRHKIKTLLVLAVVTIQYNFAQTNDTLYFDVDWKETTKANHSFYRPLPLKKVDSLVLIQDFYKNGNMQMQGYVYAINERNYAGDIYYYNEDGSDSSRSKYINATNKPLTYYHNNGTVWKTITYNNSVKVGIVKLYNNNGLEIRNEIFKNGLRVNDTLDKFASTYYSTIRNQQIEFNKNVEKIFRPTKALYWMNSGQLASVSDYQDNYTLTAQKIYDESGTVLKQYKQKDFLGSKIKEGRYYEVKTTNGFAVSIDSTSQISQQKQVVKIDDISLIQADKTNGYISLYKKIATDNYSEIDFSILHKLNANGASASFVSYNNPNSSSYSSNDLYDEDEYSIAINQIKEQTVSQLFESLKSIEWQSNYNEIISYKKDTIAHKTSFKLLNNYIFAFIDEAFTTKNYGGFGSFYTEKDDNVKKWRIDNRHFYTTRVFLLNGNKPIIILSDENDIDYYIIPTKDNKFIVNFEDSEDNIAKQQAYNQFSDQTLQTIVEYIDTRNFYSISTNSNKHYIANPFDEIVIDKPYDSIQLTKQYIIGRHKKTIDIYNIKLQKLPINTIRQVYFDRGNLQVLTDNGPFYIDALGNETQRKLISYSFCGTVSATDYTIIQTKGQKPANAIKIYYGGIGRGYHEENILKINNLDTSYTLTFLNKTKQDGYDGNSSFVDGYKNVTNVLIASKNNKFGLYSYSPEGVDFDYNRNDSALIDIDNSKYGSTDATMLLPVTYDAIQFRNPLIIVKLNNTYGIYPLDKGLRYKSLGTIKNNFMPFETLDGKKGWIDVHTLQEFYAN
ncbi:toxin-antitoxin system YwqK family antitoxin [Olleya sp. Bg11-27]|uniref:toxin-antitoxin system YwqK family antitoxin n=1 Tax=Olleya sp. Bg11-27 TaxID=2058135 RepID=UPI000C314147|nr:hypothetical protein [Olleya sp. Bg11-27]AUC76469.1 hypothetical protein CW732_12640 [Olleya sp. Bg11-27]